MLTFADILVELDAANDASSLLSPTFQASLPSSSTIGEFWPDSQHIIALPHDLQSTITSQLGAIYIGFSLLLAIMDATCSRFGSSASPAAFTHSLPWILDNMLAMWQHFKRWTASFEKRLLNDEIVALFMRLLEVFAFPNSDVEEHFLNTTKAARASASSLLDIMESDSLTRMSERNQIRLASMLIRLRSVFSKLLSSEPAHRHRQHMTRLVILSDLEANVIRICRQVYQFSHFHKDLQVSVR